MKPWREVAIPHADVLKGTFQQAEFAADLTAVHSGRAAPEYQDAAQFFERTYLTEGLRRLLTQVAARLSGQGGEPVIQLQTAFGGGKTHALLAVLHLAREGMADGVGRLNGVGRRLSSCIPNPEGFVPAKVAVIDGNAHSPGQPWTRGRTTIRTLWGELAWQLGGSAGLALVGEADAAGVSPGKEALRRLLEAYAPCVILADELVAYLRQFPEGRALSGGTYESNLSFAQALTEAVKLAPKALALVSLPESEVEAGGDRGLAALRALEKTFGRVQALWKPAATEEAFEIVRRRLFEPIRDEAARDAVCRAFADAYRAEGARLPSETQEERYYDRLRAAYPIHPEVFDRLYEDWATIEGFQRTRGVLKLMAKAVYRLWQDQNADAMILPSSLPLYDAGLRGEIAYLLPPGWESVIEREIDGERSEAADLEAREPRFGQVSAARRVARTLFLGSAPGSAATRPGIRGLERARALLGCLQPGQTAAVYADALGRLADQLHYLNSSGDKASDATRFWFDTRANLRREMEDRKRRFDEKTEVRRKTESVARRLLSGLSLFDGLHVFTPPGDVPDDSALRLVALPPEQWYMKEAPQQAQEAALAYLRSRGDQPRHRANRLLFIAADHAALNRLADAVRTALAWASIVSDVSEGRLNIDQYQRKQAEQEARAADEALPRVARECFRWLLCPAQDDPAAQPTIDVFPLDTGSGTAVSALERACRDNELVIERWSPIHLRDHLRRFYWKPDAPDVEAKRFWEDSLRYLYLPRLRSESALAGAVQAGAASEDFFGAAYGATEGRYEGLYFGQGGLTYNGKLLLIAPEVAGALAGVAREDDKDGARADAEPSRRAAPPSFSRDTVSAPSREGGQARAFRGSVEVRAALAKSRLATIAEEIIELLASDPTANVCVTLEIDAEFPNGASEAIRRGVSENAATLGFRDRTWE